MSKALRERLRESLKDVPINYKASVLLAYALGYIDDAAWKFLSGLDSFGMDQEREQQGGL
jgi:hypothetical protein